MPSHIDKYLLSQLISDQDPVENWSSVSSEDWSFLIQEAHQEGVGPLLYWRISKSGRLTSIPDNVQASLRALYSAVWAQNYQRIQELKILARLFRQTEIPLVVLKGACFALTIYPDIGLRPMGDLDILVPESKFSEAVEIAKSIGYVDAIPEASSGLGDLLNHEVSLQKTGSNPTVLEIHKSLVADKTFTYSVPVDWFWEQTEPLVVSSAKEDFAGLNMLTPTAQVLYAASHAMLQHGGKNTPLRWYYDLDQLIRVYAQRIDWDLLLSQARIFEWGSALGAAFTQTHLFFASPIPDKVWASLSRINDRHKPLIALLQNKPATHLLEERQKLLSLNWYGRFRLVSALIAPSTAYMRWRYQLKTPWALPVFYLIRWWGIFKDLLHTIVSLFQKTDSVELRENERNPPQKGG